MAKKIIKENFRVVIEPKGLGDFGLAWASDSIGCSDEEERAKMYERRCRDIVAQVKRHIDNIGWIGVEYDVREICEYCGNEWEVNQDPNDPDWELGQPLCCDKAIEEWEKERRNLERPIIGDIE